MATNETDTWTDTPSVWTNLRIANALTDAILSGDEDKPLKHAVFDAERICRQMRDEMIEAAQTAIAEAQRLIDAGVELMPLEQLSQWQGVRAWLELVEVQNVCVEDLRVHEYPM